MAGLKIEFPTSARLRRGDYRQWRFVVKRHLIQHDVLGYVNGENEIPVKAEAETDDAYKRKVDKWRKGNNTAELIIAASIEEDQFEFIDG